MDVPAPPADAPPLVADIDGTLTDDSPGVDPRVFPVVRSWPSPVVIATGKAMPYPVALCEFFAIPVHVVAENGGVVVAGRDTVRIEGDREAADAVAADYRAEGYDLGWGEADLPNRWRETELAVSRESPLDPLERIAADHGLDVVDTGFAYHVKSTAIDKGVGLRAICTELGLDPGTFLAVGDSENDVATFEAAGISVAVANADEAALAAADHVTDGAYGDGFLEAIDVVRTA
jgi:phosphoglycolate phosphatase (TIGR01487 family)